jgi:hypothetical protein
MILSSLNLALTRPQGTSIVSQALAVLGLYGADAHLYIPGVGAVNGITAGNFLDTAGTTPATLNGDVGRVDDATGSIDATEATNKPVLRQSAGLYSWQFNGTNDILKLDSVPFVMADNHLIVLGVSLSVIGSVDPFVLVDSTGSANTKGLLKLGFTGGGNYIYALRDDSNATTFLQSGDTGSINTPYVMSGRKSGTALELRVNNVSKTSTSATIGTTTLNVASIGARNLTANSNFVNGFIYPVIAIKGTVTDANRLVLEKFVGLLSGVTI